MTGRKAGSTSHPMFGLTTSRDFLDKLEAEFSDFMSEAGSARHALNCALTAFHLHEWVWANWLKADKETQAKLQISSRDGFLGWIDLACPWFPLIQDLANGTKHVRPTQFSARRVSALPFSFDVPGAGFDEGRWDGPMPFVIGERAFLLIDSGPQAGEHQWVPMGQLLDVVVRFRREFFTKFAPAPQNEGIADWRVQA